MKQRSLAIALLLLTCLFAFAACRETAEEKQTTWLGTENPDAAGTIPRQEATDTATATHPASPGGAAIIPSVTSGTTILVLLNDGSIAVRESAIPPGPAVLTVENAGSTVHNLFVEGQGLNVAAGDPIAEGGSRTASIDFRPGTYTFYCPISDHRQKGEQIQITVGGNPQLPAATTATATQTTS